MTDKELEKKAFEYRKELVPYTELGYPDVAVPVYDSIDIDRAFAAGAELMQKELEKENAELKDKLEILISVGNTCTKGLNKQLTKAKEIIKKLVNEFYYLCELYNFATDYECLAEAEQFLKESE